MGVGDGVAVGLGVAVGAGVGDGVGVATEERAEKAISVGNLLPVTPVPMNPKDAVPPAGTSLFHAKVEASNLQSVPDCETSRADQIEEIARLIRHPRDQARSGWDVLFLIATDASNPEPQSFVMVTVTEACGNSIVVFVPPVTGVGLGIGVG